MQHSVVHPMKDDRVINPSSKASKQRIVGLSPAIRTIEDVALPASRTRAALNEG